MLKTTRRKETRGSGEVMEIEGKKKETSTKEQRTFRKKAKTPG